MSGTDAIRSFAKAQYDKILAFAALLALLISLLYLAFQIGAIQRMQADAERDIQSMTPLHPEAISIGIEPFQIALNSLREPETIPVDAWTNRTLLFPQERVWCVICTLPIQFDAKQCPFCKSRQPDPDDVLRDTDGDGIPDKWEIYFGMDPLDPTDADRDRDGSGFTAREQFMLCPVKNYPIYDLNDPKSHPPYARKLYVDKITARPFPIRFRSRMRMPTGELRFQLNLGRDTFFRRLGEEVKGFKVAEFEEKFEKRVMPGSPKPRPVDVSVLTLTRGADRIPLVMDRPVQHDEFTVSFSFDVDNTRFDAKIGDAFDLRHEKYRLISVDRRQQSVVLEHVKDGELWAVRQRPALAQSLGKNGRKAVEPLEHEPLPEPLAPPPTPAPDAEPEEAAEPDPFEELFN